MSDMNDLKLQGRLARDAVLKITKNGKKLALFTLAVNQTKKNADGTYFDEANYFPCSAFIGSEKFASYLKKGQPLILEGYLKQSLKQIGDDDPSLAGKKLYESRTYIRTSKIHLIFTGKKDEAENEKIPELPENVIYENDEKDEDVFIGDEMQFF
ncbi:MAG: single-stranded DNA-binding protein [Treponema sp.]|nr:single-stranded DNA-binding protein [Treponema sp.]